MGRPARPRSGRVAIAATDVRWHDLECGGYDADLRLWRELADQGGGPVLDVGCGAGRVTLDLVRAGHAVTGLDLDGTLLAVLHERANGATVETVHADARTFSLPGRRFATILCPMQTIQLLDGAHGRAGFLRRVRDHLAPGGVFAAAIADELEPFDGSAGLPLPDMAEEDGVVYSSQPVAVEPHTDHFSIRRVRQVVGRRGELERSDDVIRLDRVTPGELRDEGTAHGLSPLPTRRIDATTEHVGSAVVVLRG